MTPTHTTEPIPLQADADGTVRVGGTRVTLDTVLHAYRDGASAEEIAGRFPAVGLDDVYAVILYYLRHRPHVEAHLADRRRQAEEVRQKIEAPFDPAGLRARLESRA